MKVIIGLLIACMVIFAVWSAAREISAYNKYLKGSREYLVSKKRRNRRLLIAFILIAEAILLFWGIFLVEFADPIQALLFWLPPLALIPLLVYLGLRDFKQTSRELDVIVREAAEDF